MSAVQATTSDGKQAKANVLFVDDEQKVLNSMRASFRREYKVFLANSGAEALEIFASNPIVVVAVRIFNILKMLLQQVFGLLIRVF